MSSDPDRFVAERLRVLHIICGAILSSLGVYAVVAWVILGQRSGGLGGGGLPSILPVALAAVAVTTLLAASAVTRLLLRRAAAAPTPEARVEGFVQATTVGFALREAAGVVGLVLSLLTGNLLWVLALGGLAALSMVIGWPRRTPLAALAWPERPPAIG